MNKKGIQRFKFSLPLGVALVGISLCSISEGFSQTNYFTWNNSTNTWSTSTAWTPTGGPQNSGSTNNTNVAVFAATGTGNNSVLLGSDRTVFGLLFTNGANSYSFASAAVSGTNLPKQLDIMSGIGLQNVSGQNQIFNLSVANNGTGLWTNSAGSTTTFNNGLQLTTANSTASRTLTLGGAGTWNVASAIANGGTATAGKVTVTATGTTTFSGNNTYDGVTLMNAAGGTLTLSGDNSGATGGVTLTAGTLNINNNNALGSGALSLAGTGATINNTSGSAVVNAGNQPWTWSDGLAFGSATNTEANNLNLGTGIVTASSSRTVALAGTGTKLTMGAVNITSISSGRTITANGERNTLEMGGLTLSANTTNAVTVTLAGTANLNITGVIVNGQAFANGVEVTGMGTTTFSGNNTYTGGTTISSGTLVLSGANLSPSYNMEGYTNNILPVLRVSATSALSTSATLSGASAGIKTGTLEFAAAGDYTINQYLGGNMNFSNSSGSATTLTFTNTTNVITSGSNGGRTLNNNSTNLILDFLGALDISSSAVSGITFGGVGDFKVRGAIFNSSNATARSLTKSGLGTLRLSATNTYNGTTTINAGKLVMVNAKALPAASPTVLDEGELKVDYAGADSDTLGNLRLTGDSTIDAGTGTSGSSLKFASATNWLSTNNILKVSNYYPVGAKIYIITTNDVPLAQIKKQEDANAVASLASDGLLTFSVPSSGSTYTGVGYVAGTENVIAANGLSNLMNYAFGQNGPTESVPAVPVLSTGSSGITLSATARTDDSSLRFYVEWTTDLSGVTDSWDLHSTEVFPSTLNRTIVGTIEYGVARKFLRFKVTKR